MKKEPDFFFITGELKDTTTYACFIMKKIIPENPDVSAILVKIHPPFYYDKKVKEVILITTPKDALFPKPTKLPKWVTMYKPLKSIQLNKPVKEEDVTIIDKGDIFKNISDIPKNYLE